MAAGMGTKSCRASPGSQWGCVWGSGRVWEGHPLSASGSLSCSLGFSCWGHRNQLELREAKGTGAMGAAIPWEGAIGGGKVSVALAATGQGQGNLMTKEGSRVGSPHPAPGAAGSVTQQRVAVPCWDTEWSPGSRAGGLAAPGCQMPVEVPDCSSCARGMKEKQREQAVPSKLRVPPRV